MEERGLLLPRFLAEVSFLSFLAAFLAALSSFFWEASMEAVKEVINGLRMPLMALVMPQSQL
jgi:hypothetical protein